MANETRKPTSDVESSAFLVALNSFERGRARWAAISALPVLALPLLSFALSGRVLSQTTIGAALFAAVGIALWRGQAFGLAVPAGLKAGIVPLAFAHAARMYGHICTSSGCTSLCFPACSVGGLAAGWIIAALARRTERPLMVLGVGGTVALLTGSLGCACVGYSGMVGMLGGLAVSLLVGGVLIRKPA